MNAVLSVFFTAVLAMCKIFLLSCVGIICACFPKSDPLISKDALRHISRLNTFVLIPSLVIFSLGSSLNFQLFIHMSLLIPFGICIICVSYIFGYLLKWIHEDDDVLYTSSLVCVGSPNGIALPLMVMASLCENSSVNEDYDGDSDACFEEASSMMFIYMIPWMFYFWSYGYTTLSSIQLKIRENSSSESLPQDLSVRQNKCNAATKKLKLVLHNPALLGVYAGLFIGLTPGLGGFLFDRMTVLQPFGGAIEVLATPVVALNSLVMAASLAHINVNWVEVFPWLARSEMWLKYHNTSDDGLEINLSDEVELELMDVSDVGITRSGCGQGQRSRTSSKNSADFASGALSSCAELRKEDEEDMNNTKEHFDKFQNSLLVKNTQNSSALIEQEMDGEPKTNIPEFRSIVFIFLCRLILCPLVLTFVVYFSIKLGLLPGHLRLMQLLIIIESAAPPAQMVVVVLNQLGLQATASTVAYTYVFLYLSSILTITMWATVAMITFY